MTTERLDLGPCTCPGMPHKSDWADMRLMWNTGQTRAVVSAIQRQVWDPTLFQVVGIVQTVAAWNLTGDDGKLRPIEVASLDELAEEPTVKLIRWVESKDRPYGLQVRRWMGTDDTPPEPAPPNPSSGPSPDGSAVTTDPMPSAPPGDGSTETEGEGSSDEPSSTSAQTSPATSQTTS